MTHHDLLSVLSFPEFFEMGLAEHGRVVIALQKNIQAVGFVSTTP
jgi:hypothetical protein